jgi:hypothetical protein
MNFTTDSLTAGPPGQPSFFPITSPAATESFSYIANFADNDNSGPDFPDQMTMTISWNQLVNGGEAELDGTGLILTSTGDTPFVTDFPVGGTTTVHGFFPTQCSLDNINGGANACDILAAMDIGKFEGGDATPQGGGGGGPGGGRDDAARPGADVELHGSRACAVLSMGHVPIDPAGAPPSRRLRLSLDI